MQFNLFKSRSDVVLVRTSACAACFAVSWCPHAAQLPGEYHFEPSRTTALTNSLLRYHLAMITTMFS